MPAAFVQTLGTSSVKAAGTTLATTFGATTAAGNLIVAEILFDNAATASKPVVSSISKPGGETASWVSLGAARSTSTSAGAFASGEMWCIKTTVAWPAAAVTVTLDTSTTMIANLFSEFYGAEATQRSTAGTNYSTTTTAASAATTGTTPVIGDLAVGFLFGSNIAAVQAGDNDLSGGVWSTPVGLGSTGSTAASNNFGLMQYKVLTSAAQQTFNNQAAMTAGNGAIVAILQASPAPTLTQASYRFYGDGTESGSTALAAQDTSYTADLTAGDVNLQLRTRLQSTNASNLAATDDFQLQWQRNAVGPWSVSTGAEALNDYYDQPSDIDVSPASQADLYGQSFLGAGMFLLRAGFFLGKSGAPTGNVWAEIRAHTGTYGAGGTGTGPPLATSTPRAQSTLQTTPQWEEFVFDGTFTLAAGTAYVVVLAIDTFAAGNTYIMRADSKLRQHSGSRVSYNGTTWTFSVGFDFLFKVIATPPAVVAFNSASLTDGAATTNRLGAGSGSFTAGKISEDGLVDDLGWAGNNYTELLYALTLAKAGFADGDTLRFRVLRNGVTTGLTYTAVPTVSVTTAAPTSPPRNIHLSNAALQPAFNR